MGLLNTVHLVHQSLIKMEELLVNYTEILIITKLKIIVTNHERNMADLISLGMVTIPMQLNLPTGSTQTVPEQVQPIYSVPQA